MIGDHAVVPVGVGSIVCHKFVANAEFTKYIVNRFTTTKE